MQMQDTERSTTMTIPITHTYNTQKHTHASLHTYNGMCGVHIHTQRAQYNSNSIFMNSNTNLNMIFISNKFANIKCIPKMFIYRNAVDFQLRNQFLKGLFDKSSIAFRIPSSSVQQLGNGAEALCVTGNGCWVLRQWRKKNAKIQENKKKKKIRCALLISGKGKAVHRAFHFTPRRRRGVASFSQEAVHYSSPFSVYSFQITL